MALTARALSYTGVECLFREDDSSDGEDIDNIDQSVVYDEFALAIQNALCANISQVTDVLQKDDESVSFTEQTNNMPDQIKQSCEVEETTGIKKEGSNTNNADELIKETSVGALEKDGLDKNTTETPVEEAEDAPIQVVSTETQTQIKQKVSGDRKKRSTRKERYQRKERKYKQIDPSDFGFHLSFIPRLVVPTPDENSVEVETQITTSSDLDRSVSNESRDQSVTKSIVSDSAQNGDIQDNESFFADIGIDINDSGSYDDEFLDWDGLRFSTTKMTTLASTPQQASKSKPVQNKSTALQVPKTQQASTSIPVQNESSPAKKKSKHKKVENLEVISVPNYKMSTHDQILFFELECHSGRAFYLRRDRHRKVLKIHKAVKTQYCVLKNIINNYGRKMVHMHHRLIKKTNINLEFRFQSRQNLSPMPKNGVDLTVAKAIRINHASSPRILKAAPPQNLNHVLHETNTPSEISLDLVSFLMSIQNRDLTPEDYDMLLRLDDNVKAKTVSTNVLEELKTEIVGPDIANILICVICMEPYLEGQTRKFLPCEHDFHSDCIDSWLANSSQNCPLDGLPIVGS